MKQNFPSITELCGKKGLASIIKFMRNFINKYRKDCFVKFGPIFKIIVRRNNVALSLAGTTRPHRFCYTM